MSEMVDRVKAALRTLRNATTEIQARAAIEAMRVPTQDMWDAAEEHNSGGGITDHGSLEADNYDLEKVWPSMISAALK